MVPHLLVTIVVVYTDVATTTDDVNDNIDEDADTKEDGKQICGRWNYFNDKSHDKHRAKYPQQQPTETSRTI